MARTVAWSGTSSPHRGARSLGSRPDGGHPQRCYRPARDADRACLRRLFPRFLPGRRAACRRRHRLSGHQRACRRGGRLGVVDRPRMPQPRLHPGLLLHRPAPPRFRQLQPHRQVLHPRPRQVRPLPRHHQQRLCLAKRQSRPPRHRLLRLPPRHLPHLQQPTLRHLRPVRPCLRRRRRHHLCRRRPPHPAHPPAQHRPRLLPHQPRRRQRHLLHHPRHHRPLPLQRRLLRPGPSLSQTLRLPAGRPRHRGRLLLVPRRRLRHRPHLRPFRSLLRLRLRHRQQNLRPHLRPSLPHAQVLLFSHSHPHHSASNPDSHPSIRLHRQPRGLHPAGLGQLRRLQLPRDRPAGHRAPLHLLPGVHLLLPGQPRHCHLHRPRDLCLLPRQRRAVPRHLVQLRRPSCQLLRDLRPA